MWIPNSLLTLWIQNLGESSHHNHALHFNLKFNNFISVGNEGKINFSFMVEKVVAHQFIVLCSCEQNRIKHTLFAQIKRNAWCSIKHVCQEMWFCYYYFYFFSISFFRSPSISSFTFCFRFSSIVSQELCSFCFHYNAYRTVIRGISRYYLLSILFVQSIRAQYLFGYVDAIIMRCVWREARLF